MSEEPGLTAITTPPPTVNGGLHIGHLSGPYLAADMAARAARAAGAQVVLTTGLDVHQNYVLVRAERDGSDVARMLDQFRDEIVDALTTARVGYDRFTDTRAREHTDAIDGLLGELVTRGRLPMREVALRSCGGCGRTLHHAYVTGRCIRCGSDAGGGTCEGCGAYTCAATLVDPACTQCGGQPRELRATVPVLVMEDQREAITAMMRRADVPAQVRGLVERQLADGLPEVPVAYPTDWGIEGTGPLAGLRVDSYIEMALTDFYGIARAVVAAADGLDGYTSAWEKVDQLWHFGGIDNAYYYALLWPAMFAAAGLEPLPMSGLAVNQFYTLAGSKVSTSRNHVVWANDLLTREDPAVVRLYLAWDRPDRYASDFTWPAFTAFRDHVQPLLAGAVRGRSPVPGPLADAERARGMRALRLPGFDPALAARSLLSLLAAGADPEPLRACLTGTAVEPVGGRDGHDTAGRG
jgi:methionyl-tRNA synthetase